MYPGWPPRYGDSATQPAVPPPDTAFQSFRDQHLAQLEQLQRMHQRQLESVLPVGAPPGPVPPHPHYTPRQPAAYLYPPPPYSHAGPPPGYLPPVPQPAQPPPPEPEQPPPPPAPEQPPLPPPASDDSQSSVSLEEQQQYYYKQHLLNLQQKSKSRAKEAAAAGNTTSTHQTHDSGVYTSTGYAPPPLTQEPPPLPPPVDETPPPLPVEDATPTINLTEDPEQAERLKTLQEAAAHWQQHEQHRLGFQYQGIIQKHSALQQLLQRYQQILQDPPHLAALSVDVQLQHHEMQQKQFLLLHQEWESQFKKWQELLQTYPHKNQLQEYHVQWTSWQTQMKTTRSQLKEKVASLKSLKQQYGGNHYMAVVPPYSPFPQVMPPAVPPPVPTGISIPPSFAPGPPLYSTVPPPPLPSATAYSEDTPPLPPVSAPPLPPVTSAPPPPPPVTSSPVEAVKPPLPPDNSTECSEPPPPPATHPPECLNTSAIATHPVSSSTNTLHPTSSSNDPSTASSFTSGGESLQSSLSYEAHQALRNSMPSSYTPMLNTVPPFSCLIPPPEAPTTDLPASKPLEKNTAPIEQDPNPSNTAPRLLKPPNLEQAATAPLPPHEIIRGGQFDGVRGPSFAAQGRGSPSLRFHTAGPRGPHGFHGPRPMLDAKNFQVSSALTVGPPNSANDAFPAQSQPWVKEQLAESVAGDLTKSSNDKIRENFEPSVQMETPSKDAWGKGDPSIQGNVGRPGESSGRRWDEQQGRPENRWDRPGEPLHRSWDKSVVPQESSWGKPGGTARDKWDQKESFTNRVGGSGGPPSESLGSVEAPSKDKSDNPDKQMVDRVEGPAKDMWSRPESSQFGRQDNPRDRMGSKWDEPPDGRWSSANKLPQDSGGLENPSLDRFGNADGPGRLRGPEGPPLNRFGDPKGERFGDHMGPSSDRFGAPEGPPRDRFGAPEGPPRDRFGAPEGPPRDRFGAPEGPPRDRFGAPEGPPRDRFGAPEGPPRDRFGAPEGPPRDRFGAHEGPPRDRFGAPEGPPRDRFGAPEGPPRDRFGAPEGPPRDKFGAPEGPPRDKFGAPEGPPRDKFGAPEGPQRDKFGAPEGPPRDKFSAPEGPPRDKFGAPEGPPLDRFGAQRDRFGAPEGPPRDRFGAPEGPPLNRFGAPEGPPVNRFGAPEGPLLNRFGAPEGPPLNRFGDPKGAPTERFGDHMGPSSDRFVAPEGLSQDRFGAQRDRFGAPEGPTQDRFGAPESPQRDRFGLPEGPPQDRFGAQRDRFGAPEGSRFGGLEGPPQDRFGGLEGPPQDRFGGLEGPPQDRFVGPEGPAQDKFGGPEGPPQDRFGGPEGPLQDRFGVPEVPYRDRFGHPDGSHRGRFGMPELPPRGRARFPGEPQRGRFGFPEGHSQDRFRVPEGRFPETREGLPQDRFGGPEGALRDRFSLSDLPQDHFGGPELSLSRDRFGRPELPRDRFGGPELPPSRDRFGGPELPKSRDRFGGFEDTQRDNWGFTGERDRFDSPEIPSQDSRAPFNNRETLEKPELHMDERWNKPVGHRNDKWDSPGGERVEVHKAGPSIPPESQAGKDINLPGVHFKSNEINTPNVPTGSYQSQFRKGNQVTKVAGDQVGKMPAKPVDVEMKNVDEPPKVGLPSKGESPAVTDPPKVASTTTAGLKKSDETTNSSVAKTEKEADQTVATSSSKSDDKLLPVPDKEKDPVAPAPAPLDTAVQLGDSKALSTSNLKSSKLPGLSESITSQGPTPGATKPDTSQGPASSATTKTLASNTQTELQASTDTSGVPEDPSPTKQNESQATSSTKLGPPQTTPITVGAPQTAPHVRPGAPQVSTPVRLSAPWMPSPVRPGAPRVPPPVIPGATRAPAPFRPGAPQMAPPVRLGAPRAAPPFRPGAPSMAPQVRPVAPQVRPGALLVTPGAPRATPIVRPGAPPIRPGAPPIRPGAPRAAYPFRPGVPRLALPVRPGCPLIPTPPNMDISENFSATNFHGVVDPKTQGFYKGGDPALMMNKPQIQLGHKSMHVPEARQGHLRPDFSNQEVDTGGVNLHHETARPGGLREFEMSDEPEHYPDDWPGQGNRRENFETRFDNRGRGRARGFIGDRIPPRPGNRDVMEVPEERGFGPRDPFVDERPPFREGPNDPLPYVRDPFLGEPRFPPRERERFPLDPLLDARRRDFPLEGERNDDWERDRYWRDREAEIHRDPYFRDEGPPFPIPPLPRDLDVRHEPWFDRLLDRDRDSFFERRERRYLFDPEVSRDYPRIPDDLDIPLRDRDWLPPRRSLSPHRPFSPVRARSPLPPLPPLDRYLDDRWKLDRDLADRDFRDRGELRVREYPERPLWHEERKTVFPERPGLEPRDDRWYPSEDRAVGAGLDPLAPQPLVLPEQSAVPESDSSPSSVLALSQRQHEIILKAAQELKMLREQKEQLDNLKHFFNETKPSDALNQKSADGLQPPGLAEKDKSSSVLPASIGGRGVSDRWDEDSFNGLWDDERRSLSLGSKLSGIQQTVDYAHGRDLAVGKVEQTPYGERVMLLPEPGLDRGIPPFPKDYLIDCYDRDLRDRDPYFERSSSKNLDRREYERERERDRDRSDSHRDRGEHDRERFDRDRHSREDRSSYRDKESSSRRSDKPPYDRKPDRPSYEAPPTAFGGSRRNYPEERTAMPPPVPVPPLEKKPETKNVDDLLKTPGRDSRPDRIVVIMRGLPGSGKTHVAKLIRDKEVECGGSAPRVLSLDDYFITEVEKVDKDPESGKKIKRKVMEYEYELEMEEIYRSGMLKTFKKTLDDGFFPFIILDSIHDRARHFEQFWSAAKTKGFEVYLAEITADTQTCAKRNSHGRKLKEINKMADNWEPAPRHMIRLDIRSLLQDAAIVEVEMEDSEPSLESQKEAKKETSEEEESDRGYLPKSKWEMDTSEAKLDKLDGLKVRKRDWESMAGCMEDYLQLPDDYDSRESEPGKKRVRWADLEEKKDADRKRAIGFVVGQTDWEKITDKSGHLAERALNRTKYI